MQTSTVRLYSLPYGQAKTYGIALLFVAGNIILPQLFHLLPQGGIIWLPIYFFTLVAAYKYGWKAGLLTAVLSPVFNSALFGMPAAATLPAILLKSVCLALVAGFTAAHFKKASLVLLAAVIIAYQALGFVGEWAMTGSAYLAAQDFRLGIPGMLLQIFGGYACINYIIRK